MAGSTNHYLKIALNIAYEGSDYLGWQKSPLGPTVEGTLSQSLTKLLGYTPMIEAASRTDKGVHAKGQVATVDLCKPYPLDDLKYRLNKLLPYSIKVLQCYQVEMTFHPSVDSRGKEYSYAIETDGVLLPFHRHTRLHYPYALNIEAMQEGANQLVGTYNFSSFTTAEKPFDPMRTIESISITQEECLKITIRGKSFLYKMCRSIVGTLLYIGKGKRSYKDIPTLLKHYNPFLRGPLAPAHGLTLERVYY